MSVSREPDAAEAQWNLIVLYLLSLIIDDLTGRPLGTLALEAIHDR